MHEFEHVTIDTFDPDAGRYPGPPIWPTLTGRIVKYVRGLRDVFWAVLELDTPPPLGFNPLHSLPAEYRQRPIQHLLAIPAPNIPTLQVPPDYIPEALREGHMAQVWLSVGESLTELPSVLSIPPPPAEPYPLMCMGRMRRTPGTSSRPT